MNWLDAIITIFAFSAALRILLYHRNGSVFKRHISIIAYLCIVGCGWLGWSVLTQQITNHDIPVLLIPVFIVCVLFIFYAQGNVSQLIKWIIGRS